MILLTTSEVLSTHSKLITKTGGADGIRDIALLESALASANTSYDSIEKYPSIEEKAARLAYSIISNHAFIDGNKRIGILVMLMTLKLNKININYTQKELIYIGLSIADESMGYDDVYDFIIEHKV